MIRKCPVSQNTMLPYSFRMSGFPELFKETKNTDLKDEQAVWRLIRQLTGARNSMSEFMRKVLRAKAGEFGPTDRERAPIKARARYDFDRDSGTLSLKAEILNASVRDARSKRAFVAAVLLPLFRFTGECRDGCIWVAKRPPHNGSGWANTAASVLARACELYEGNDPAFNDVGSPDFWDSAVTSGGYLPLPLETTYVTDTASLIRLDPATNQVRLDFLDPDA